jgi:integrase
MASPYEYRPGHWRAHVSVGGVRHNQTFTSLEEAELWIAQRTLARKRGMPVEPATKRRGGPTVTEFYTEWSASRDNDVDLVPATRAKYRSYWVNHIEPMWGKLPLAQLTHSKLDAWVRHMDSEGVGADTVHGVVGHLGAMLAAAVADGKIVSNPRKKMRNLPTIARPRRRAATDVELAAILANSKGQYKIMWQLMAESGLRWNECAGVHGWQLNLADVERASIHVLSTVDRNGVVRLYPKSKKGRDVPISPEVAQALREHMLGRDPGGLVFLSEGGRPLRYHNVIGRVWEPTCETAGVELGLHELRHTAITNWLDAGIPPSVVADLAGHADLRMISRYGHTTGRAFDDARQAMIR